MVTIWVVKICKKNLLEIINYRLKERIKWKEFKSPLSEEKKDWGCKVGLGKPDAHLKKLLQMNLEFIEKM